MLYVKSECGKLVPITYDGVFTKCPDCGAVHQVDIAEMMECCGGDVEECSAYCEKCSRKYTPMSDNTDKLLDIANRFEVSPVEVQRIVCSGLDRGLSIDACLVGARLILSMKTGKHELFNLDDVSAALGCSKEEAAAELEKMGVKPMKLSTLPGFEFLLGRE